MDIIAFIFFVLFIGSLFALFRGHLNLFKVIPIPNRKIASILTIVFFVAFFIAVPAPTEDPNAQANNESDPETNLENETSDIEEDESKDNTEEQSEEQESQDDNNSAKQSEDSNRNSSDDDKEKEDKQDDENNSSDSNEPSNNSSNDKEKEDSSKEDSSKSEDSSSSNDNKANSSTKEKNKSKDDGNNSNLDTATVTRIVDGDTIEINLNGTVESVRLLLVDTPETKHPSKPVQPFGPEASKFATNVLSGKEVKVEYDGPKRDHYGRLLAYLWVDGKNFNKMLLEEGFARLAYVYDPPYTHMDSFTKAQTRAMNAGKNIWSIKGYVQSDGFNYEESTTKNNKEDKQETKEKEKSDTSDTASSGYDGPYDPNGPDRNCGDFDTHAEAQAFYEAAGGPESDPHGLDGNDKDGLACESLP
ncbi:hypothetical protein CEY16_05590 [Halalkalibacillus sediminis]|uniref:TNase-like domain-containing protein n=1 Tax=Halalkalibacillus sediminis TaxID=2018042 RepID=A0A2I0QY05_9BACI|nr:thermonuclease family protein [Halalkalibacillus sediminis]PKR79213.1 hypothetical protein CEY16_05590 [Halalkalibacillus sediminis]